MLILKICYGIMSVNPQHVVDVEYTVVIITRGYFPKTKLY